MHFKYIDDVIIDDRSQIGFIAQDVEKYYPKGVNVSPYYKTIQKIRIVKDKDDNDVEEKYNEEILILEDAKTLNVDQINKMHYGVTKKLIQKIEILEEQNTTLHTQNNYLLGKIKLLFEELKTMNEKIDKLEHHLNTDLFDNTSINKNDEIPDKFSITG
jgi:predicted nuclease with TOPRIM domain